METLIRSAQMAPFRTRLSDTAALHAAPDAVPDPVPGGAPSEQEEQAARRADIETEWRTRMEEQAEMIAGKAREEARREGYAAGMAQADAKVAAALDDAKRKFETAQIEAMSALAQAHAAALSALESSVGEVAFAAVVRWLGLEAASETFLMAMVKNTCAELRSQTMATARLHPRDIATLRGLLQAAASAQAGSLGVELDGDGLRIGALALTLIPDTSLSLGGCVIETATGQFDGGLEAQLRRLHELLVPASSIPGRMPSLLSAGD